MTYAGEPVKHRRTARTKAEIAFDELATNLRAARGKDKNAYKQLVSDFVKKYGPQLIAGKKPKLNRFGLPRGAKRFPKRGTKSLRSGLSGFGRQTGAPAVQGGLPGMGKR